MASAQRLSQLALIDIAAQISERLPPASRFIEASAPESEIGESLKVLRLELGDLRKSPGKPLDDALVNTGLWHHQLYRGDQSRQFARSIETAARRSGHEVVELVTSPIPDAIARAITWVDANIAQEADTQILEIPDYLLTALYLRGPAIDAVVIAAMAPHLQGLALNEAIPQDRFVQQLLANPPVSGLGSRPAANQE